MPQGSNEMLKGRQWATPVHSNTQPMPLPMYYPQNPTYNNPGNHQYFHSHNPEPVYSGVYNSAYSEQGLNEVHFSKTKRMQEIIRLIFKHRDVLDSKDRKSLNRYFFGVATAVTLGATHAGYSTYYLYNVFKGKINFNMRRYTQLLGSGAFTFFIFLTINYRMSKFFNRISTDYFGNLTDDQIANFDAYKSWYMEIRNPPIRYNYPNIQNY